MIDKGAFRPRSERPHSFFRIILSTVVSRNKYATLKNSHCAAAEWTVAECDKFHEAVQNGGRENVMVIALARGSPVSFAQALHSLQPRRSKHSEA